MWRELKNRQRFKVRFKRQHPIDIFIVDFYCHEYKLAIEIDGEIHMNEDVSQYDQGRAYELEKHGIKIIRFSNNEIFSDMETVIKNISAAVS